MLYKNIAGRFFGLVSKHACDSLTGGQIDRQTEGQTDRITTPKTALAQLRRAVKKLPFGRETPYYILGYSPTYLGLIDDK